jgi:hypothetical protein
MSEDDKIFVDASQSAALLHSGRVVDCPTLQEAVLAFYRLPSEEQAGATIRVRGGAVYTAREIANLHYAANSK